jgi:hypothetical protein
MANPWKSSGGRRQLIVILFGVVGATPTISFRIEGSTDAVNWVTVAMIKEGAAGAQSIINVDTETAGNQAMAFMLVNGWWPYLHIFVSSNTNIPVSNAWLCEDGVVTPATVTETTITGNLALQ